MPPVAAGRGGAARERAPQRVRKEGSCVLPRRPGAWCVSPRSVAARTQPRSTCACVGECVHACVRACVRACVMPCVGVAAGPGPLRLGNHRPRVQVPLWVGRAVGNCKPRRLRPAVPQPRLWCFAGVHGPRDKGGVCVHGHVHPCFAGAPRRCLLVASCGHACRAWQGPPFVSYHSPRPPPRDAHIASSPPPPRSCTPDLRMRCTDLLSARGGARAGGHAAGAGGAV